MMKRFFYIFLVSLLTLWSVQAQEANSMCDLGFAFQISGNRSWGFGEPVITDVTPNSPAERAGLRVNDVIVAVNGRNTHLQEPQMMWSWFFENPTMVRLAIRNLQHTRREIDIYKHCRYTNAISETQLAPLFAFYSLEDVQNRQFMLSLSTFSNEQAVFHNYRTFAFAAAEPDDDLILNARINHLFTRELTQMGLTYDPIDPDFIIRTFFSYQPNPLFDSNSETIGSYRPVWRLDTRTNRMVRIPVFDPAEVVRISDIPFHLEFGYQFFDRRFFEPGQNALMWEGRVSERLSAHFPLVDYLEFHLPLMLKKFPNPGNRTFTTYHVRTIRHNYTGISFDIDDLRTVVSVSPNSPAAMAGILPGDVIFSIQGQRFNHRNAHALTTGYRRFIAETMHLRDPGTRFTDAYGFSNAMFWDAARYADVARAIRNHRRYRAVFAYLFNFNPFIDRYTPRTIDIEVQRDRERISFNVMPRILLSSQIVVN